MRRVVLCSVSLLALGVLAGCGGGGPRQVSAAPPSVSYRVPANDVSQANVSAANYCRQYNMGFQLQGVQPQGSESIAYYACTGTPVASAAPVYTNPGYTPPSYTAPGYSSGQVYSSAPTTYSTGSQAYATPVAPQVYAAPVEPVQCADFFHQDRPGGSDYRGPPVPGCPQR